MSYDKELEIQRQFLDEAQEYLDTLDSAVMGLSSDRVDIQKINAALRAAHSIKGGAAMMGFDLLSQLAHALEDSFKVLKTQGQSVEIDESLENLLLDSVSCLRTVIQCEKQEQPVDRDWVGQEADPIFSQLHDRLGDPQDEDAASVLAMDSGQDIIPIIFESEVEGCLERLESVMSDPDKPCLKEELTILAQELGGLGEMLQLEAFSKLCESVQHAIEALPDEIEAIADAAMQAWRRSQALVLTGQVDLMPTSIPGEFILAADPPILTEAVPTKWLDIDISQDDDTVVMASMVDGEQVVDEEAAQKFQRTWQDVAVAASSSVTDNVAADPLVDDEAAWIVAHQEISTSHEADWAAAYQETSTSHEADWAAAYQETSASHEADWAAAYQETSTSHEADWVAAHPEPNVEIHSTQTPTEQPQPTAKESQATDFKVLNIKADTQVSVPEEDQNATVRVSVRQLNQLNDLFGELTIQRNGLDLYLKRLRGLARLLNQRVRLLEQSNSQMRSVYDRIIPRTVNRHGLPLLAPAADSIDSTLYPFNSSISNLKSTVSHFKPDHDILSRFDALEMDQYNDLHLLSQQVMETIVQVQEVSSDIELSLDDSEQTTRELNKTAKHLQTNLTQIRMRPISDVVDRFPRALRELCLQYGKKVRLSVKGGNTLIERSILEVLSDPLMHLVRNAFDHGIEAPERRRQQGKPDEGVIEIRAAHRGNRTIITISDDGKGISLNKIRTKAEQMGLDATLLATASDEDLLSLIFEPGFSTSDRVTTLSGRGVGMDVVRDSLKQIRGEISVDTRAGVGTTFTLSVPFTLSVVQILLVESNGMLLAFPTDAIKETQLFSEDALTHDGEAFNWQDTQAKLIYLSRWLQFNCIRQPHTPEAAPSIDASTVLMVNQGSQVVALQVDRCWSEQEVAIRRVEGNLPMPAGFSGCAIVADGRVVPLVNIPELLDWIAGSEQASSGEDVLKSLMLPPAILSSTNANLRLPPASQLSSPLPIQPLTVLIIDDSINIRRFLALTLERAGFRVEQAKDGQDALEKLQRGLSVQAVICDIEMPRLDGYGFLAKFKTIPEFQAIPVAMLTSRSGEKHRQLAISLGAAAYFSKPYNEQVLVRTLEQLVGSAVLTPSS
ncbi:MAG: response regulator [Leptolyngbyaceae cyanobacterium RU_5_1]|nr:response regulator [Leptolyngbyaceae cyanobacterium RU_5_1]